MINDEVIQAIRVILEANVTRNKIGAINYFDLEK